MARFKELFKNVRMIILLVALILGAVAIYPDFARSGVAIRGVERNSSAALAGMVPPDPMDKPMFREVITSLNGVQVHDEVDFEHEVKKIGYGTIVRVLTMGNYDLTAQGRKFSLLRKQKSYVLTAREGEPHFGLTIYDAPKTNLRKGLDLQGGTRVLLQPEEEVSPTDLDIILENLKQRLNVYGLSDIIVRGIKDLQGNLFVVVEIAGANEQEVKELISGQGKFEAKISNSTVFRGGQDIRNVCRTPDCSFAQNPQRPCGQSGSAWACSFLFTIALSPEAAQRHADITKNISVVRGDGGDDYLAESLDLYMDDVLVDTLRIGAELKGKPETSIAISGPGSGATREEALKSSSKNMRRLQTVLITGSLPVKMKIVKTDTLSPTLGKEFLNNILFIGILSIIAVSLVVFVRYHSFIVSGAIIFTMLAEIVLILGFAALVGWNLDLIALAGILVAIGTGVDDQIVIADETRKKQALEIVNWRDRIKNAFFIIFGAYLLTVVSMIPLAWAGAGLLKGFAITTVAGVTIGVFVTRPAYAVLVEYLSKD